MAKTKLTEEKIKTAVKMVEKGHYYKDIYGVLGVCKKTWQNWINRGKEAKSGIYRKFYEEIEKADSRGEAYLFDKMMEVGKEEWQMYMTILERKYPDRFGKHERMNISSEEGTKIIIEKVDASVKSNTESSGE